MIRGLPRRSRVVLALMPVQWVFGVMALWLLPQRGGAGNTESPDPAAWLVVAAVIALQVGAVLWKSGDGVAPLLSLIAGVFVFSALTLLETIAHATLI